MKLSLFTTLLFWMVLLLVLTACAPPRPAAAGFSAPASTSIDDTSLQSTESPTEPTEFQPLPTQALPQQTTNLSVNVNSLSNSSFEVRANTDLALSDASGDGRANDCTIAPLSGSGSSRNITIPSTGTVTFRLAAGSYKLYCGNPNVYASLRVSN